MIYLVVAVASLLVLLPSTAEAAALDRSDSVRVFLDCASCDEQFVRTEVTFVDYVRDRTAADVHVLITSQGTGGGGVEYTVKFIGLGRFRDVDNSLTYAAPQTATLDERRRGLVSTLKLGLVRYAADSSVASRLTLRFDEPATRVSAQKEKDPWNFWVFRIGGNGGFEGEQSRNLRAVSGNFSANRTTDDWKINLNGFANLLVRSRLRHQLLVRLDLQQRRQSAVQERRRLLIAPPSREMLPRPPAAFTNTPSRLSRKSVESPAAFASHSPGISIGSPAHGLSRK